MPYDIVLGRDPSDKKKFGDRGLIYLGKGYVTMGTYTSLSNKIYMDVARSHVVLVAGKRGSGKSYTLGVMTEELTNLPPETAHNLSSLIFDTMGIFWTMKFKNEKDKPLLQDWDLETKSLPIKVFVPAGKAEEYKQRNIPVDEVFALNAAELDSEDWLLTFNLSMTSPQGVLVTSVISELKKFHDFFTITEINHAVHTNPHASQETKQSVQALFAAADSWGIFSKGKEQSTPISSLVTPATTSILDLSIYNSVGSFNVRALVIGLISKKLFNERMDARKKEEISAITHGTDYLSGNTQKETPLIWLFIDEAHEFLPKNEKTPATDALIQLLREGRQPGISVVLATQQPGQIHTDVMTQSDIVLSHRVTSKADTEALNQIMQNYVLDSIKQKMDELPHTKGSAIILDDNSERIYSIRVRPRFTWHGGEAPTAIPPSTEI